MARRSSPFGQTHIKMRSYGYDDSQGSDPANSRKGNWPDRPAKRVRWRDRHEHSGVHLIKGMTTTNPSPRHQWVYLRGTSALYTGAVERCARCGAHFVEKADTRGPIYCAPTPQWLREHPEDDRKER